LQHGKTRQRRAARSGNPPPGEAGHRRVYNARYHRKDRMSTSFTLLAGCATLGVVLTAQPAPSPRDVRERAWQANNLGVAYLEQFNYAQAATQFESALAIDGAFVPARVNLAIARMYEPDLPAALKAATAAAAAPSAPPHADFVLGLIARTENREEDALAAFRRVLQVDPADVASLVNLGQLLLQQRAYAEAVPVFGKAVELEPYNVSALYNLAVAQTRAGQREIGAATTAKFQVLRETGYGTTYSNTYMEQGRYAEAILSTGAEPDLAAAAPPALTYAPAAAAALIALGAHPAPQAVGAGDINRDGATDLVVAGASWLDVYSATRGSALMRTAPAQRPTWPVPAGLEPRGVVIADVDNDGKPDLLLHGRGGIALWRQQAGKSGAATSGTQEPRSTGTQEHRSPGAQEHIDFEDVTARSGITTALDVRTAALVDLDHDGDVDLVFGGATRDGGAEAPLVVWRNNGDGTFADISTTALPEQAPLVARAIVPADVDLRRDIDLVVLGEDGRVRLWRNMRDASFREVAASVGLDALPPASAIAVGDATKDGFPDIAASVRSGTSVLAVGASNNRFTARPLEALPTGALAAQMVDADNDGLLDVVTLTADGVRVARQAAGGAFEDATGRTGLTGLTNADLSAVASAKAERRTPNAVGANPGAPVPPPDSRVSTPDSRLPTPAALVLLDADLSGSMDIVTVRDGKVALLVANGVAAPAFRVALTGQVSNRSGVGSKVEMRAGSLWQKLETSAASPAAAPADILFGLGGRSAVDVVRVLWPAGIVQAEAIASDTQAKRSLEVVELDRKPSSCPYLYTWDGERFSFATDFLGGGEMGYQVAPGVHSTPDPEEYVRIRGDQLRPRDGRYELRVTNELEETLFLDHLSLVVIDHPTGTDVFPREGLVSSPAQGLQLATVRDRRAARRVTDAAGTDATANAAHTDRAYVDGLPLLPIRGYAKSHAMTVDLGPDTPARGAVLLLTGWTDYAFSSDNVAASHAGYALQPPSLQVRDASGRWTTMIDEIGVPVGRPQTIVIDLTDRFLSASREVRIVTSMRVYWDQIEVATKAGGVDQAASGDRALPSTRARRDRRAGSPRPAHAGGGEDRIVVTRVNASGADLRWRGFSEMMSPREPLAFDYDRVTPTSPWKQMPGRYTREGDVTALLAAVDDQFVVARPGDEVALAFDATTLPAVRDGWTRTFLLHGDGYSKEMAINSASPDQAWPLPSHRMTHYPTTRSPLDEPAWFTRYNTRVVARQVPRLAGVPIPARVPHRVGGDPGAGGSAKEGGRR
jgi:tetratricopeptide (TPR) repeat protein